MSLPSVGVCLFDDPASPQGGFASLLGGEPFYVAGYHELPQTTLWITNLDYKVFRDLNLLRVRYLAQSQYFRTSMKLIQKELGLPDSKQSSQILSKIFSRVITLGKNHFGADHMKSNYRYHQCLMETIDIPGLHERPQGLDTNLIQMVIDHSTQENQAMTGVKRPERSSPVAFLFPRDAFGQWLMGRHYPIGNTYKNDGFNKEYTVGTRDGKKIPVTESLIKRLAEYAGRGRAMFFRISIVSQEPTHRAFASFGAGSNDPRVWVSWPELLEIVEYSVITIYESVSTVGGSIKEFLPDFVNTSGCGFSEGLLLENLYASLSAPINKRNTALGAYIRAYDRMACQRAAQIFHAAGFTVGSYSSGRVVLMLPDSQMERATKVALDNGMLPPLKESVFDE